MNNLKKAGVMAVVALFTISMVLVPFTPMTQIQPVAAPEGATPEDVLMDIERYVDTQKEGGPLGSILASYRDTGYVPNTVSRNDAGDVGLLVTVRSESDVASLEEIIDVNWKVEIGAMTIANGFVNSPSAVAELENFDGIVTAFADSLYRETTRDVEPRPDITPPTVSEPEAYAINPHIGADQVWAAGYDGTGVTVGVVDTGVDFSVEGLVGTMDIGSDGLSTSFDPTGYGFVVSLYRANATVVNATAYLAYSSWNVLSYESNGKYYIDWSTCLRGIDVNNQGGLSDLDWFYNAYLGAWWSGTNPGNTYPGNITAMTAYYNDVIRADPEIPDPSFTMSGPALNITNNATSGEWAMVPYYTAGYAFQQRGDPYAKIFAPVLVLNGDTIVVDWNTTRAHTDFWNLNINYGAYDFGDPATIARYDAMIDNSFVDDFEAGLIYKPDGTEAHLNMYYDYPSDGMRFGLGTLATVDEGNIFGLGLVHGIGLSGRALGIMYDGDSHGTFVSGEIAGQPTAYPVGTGGAMETLQGIAPGSKITGVMTVGIAAEFISMLWVAGFDINYTSGYWEWNWNSDHQTQISSNSWGWVAPQYYELWGAYALIYSAMATPGFFNATYPGMVQCFSAGNSGPGYGTTTPPRAPQIINVGASTSYHTFNDAYGPGQGFDQIADFSSRGPLAMGYPKPDVLAPGRNNYGFVPTYGGTFGITAGTPYAVYAGTSMACPLVAGLAALMFDADPTLAPDEVKYIMQSTADDIGMDGLAQGHGVINAWAAVDFVANNHGYTFFTEDSIDNWSTVTDEAWKFYNNPYDWEAFWNTSTAPVDFADGNLYFGIVDAEDSVTMTVEGDNWVFGDMTWTAEHYIADQTTSFEFETFIYNETTSTGYDETKGGYMVLDTLMEAASTGSYTNFEDADYATISIAGDQATFDDDSIWAFVFDWVDNDPANGIPDYYNTTFDTGDELTRWSYAGGTGNVLKIDLSYPGGLSNLFPNTPIIMVHDDNIWSWPYTDGNDLTVTVQTWTLAADANIGIVDNSDDADVTLTVPATPEYGVHQGFVVANNGTMDFKLPYTYFVKANYTTAGTVMELAEGAGAVQTPYEHGTVTAGWDSYYTSRSADHMTFIVDLTDQTVNYFAARINWTNADTDMDVAIVDMIGYELAHSGDAVKATTNSALAIADISSNPWTTPTTRYIIYTSLNAMDGSDVPEDFTLTVVGLDALDDPTLELSWTSRTDATPEVITTGGSAVGDHVMLKARWIDGVNPGMPELSITSVEMKVLYGSLYTNSGPHVPASDPGGIFAGIIDPSQFAWDTAPGIVTGDNVRIEVDFDGADDDVMVWWSDTPMGERTYANNLVGGTMATGAHPEQGSFLADRDGDIDVGMCDFANSGGNWYLTVDTRLGLEPDRGLGNEFEMDTYYLLANQTYAVLVDSDTGTNLRYREEIPGIFIGNFFAPEVTVNDAVATTGNSFDFTWSVTDQNADDVHRYSIWLSSDGGVSYQILARNLTATSFTWDSSGFLERDNYILRVRAYSLDWTAGVEISLADEAGYWPGDFGDGFSAEFAAGDVPPPTTPTTPPPPTTPTTPPVQGIDPLLIGLIGGIGVGVVILLILFLIRKK